MGFHTSVPLHSMQQKSPFSTKGKSNFFLSHFYVESKSNKHIFGLITDELTQLSWSVKYLHELN